MKSKKKNGAGKGDGPRSNYSQAFRKGHESINWGHEKIDLRKILKEVEEEKKLGRLMK